MTWRNDDSPAAMIEGERAAYSLEAWFVNDSTTPAHVTLTDDDGNQVDIDVDDLGFVAEVLDEMAATLSQGATE